MWHRKLTSTASLLPTINHFGPEQGSATVGTPDQAGPDCCWCTYQFCLCVNVPYLYSITVY